jgi:hypothetical protein
MMQGARSGSSGAAGRATIGSFSSEIRSKYMVLSAKQGDGLASCTETSSGGHGSN